jgi:hypothetical protein
MPVIILHLRWDDVSSEQFDCVCQVVPPGSELPVGCCSYQLRHVGSTLLGTAVWSDEASAEAHLVVLPTLLAPARLSPPQVVAFSVPSVYGVGYTGPRVHQATRQAGATSAAVPVRRADSVSVRTAPIPLPEPVLVP